MVFTALMCRPRASLEHRGSTISAIFADQVHVPTTCLMLVQHVQVHGRHAGLPAIPSMCVHLYAEHDAAEPPASCMYEGPTFRVRPTNRFLGSKLGPAASHMLNISLQHFMQHNSGYCFSASWPGSHIKSNTLASWLFQGDYAKAEHQEGISKPVHLGSEPLGANSGCSSGFQPKQSLSLNSGQVL